MDIRKWSGGQSILCLGLVSDAWRYPPSKPRVALAAHFRLPYLYHTFIMTSASSRKAVTQIHLPISPDSERGSDSDCSAEVKSPSVVVGLDWTIDDVFGEVDSSLGRGLVTSGQQDQTLQKEQPSVSTGNVPSSNGGKTSWVDGREYFKLPPKGRQRPFPRRQQMQVTKLDDEGLMRYAGSPYNPQTVVFDGGDLRASEGEGTVQTASSLCTKDPHAEGEVMLPSSGVAADESCAYILESRGPIDRSFGQIIECGGTAASGVGDDRHGYPGGATSSASYPGTDVRSGGDSTGHGMTRRGGLHRSGRWELDESHTA